MARRSVDTPIGPVTIVEDEGMIVGLDWGCGYNDDTKLMRDACSWVEAYFNGNATDCDLPMRVDAAPHVQQVCEVMSAIPFGETRTYGDIAKETGLVPQTVGQACGLNPIPIMIPCHRVLAANGLGGFSAKGGVETKVALLRHEGAAGLLI